MLVGKYRLSKVIGDGTFSVVKLGYHIFTQEAVAVKIVDKKVVAQSEDPTWLRREVDVLKRLEHPGVVKMIDFIEDEENYYIVMEYLNGGELYDFIISHHRVKESQAKKFFKQIALTVAYIHSKGIIHRDLKPENLLLSESCNIKLIDFGLCSTDKSSIMRNQCGSMLYLAPEAITKSAYRGEPADIWALGVILYTLVVGEIPWDFENETKMTNQIVKAEFTLPPTLSVQCQNLIRAILTPNPKDRITIDKILAHEWLFAVGNVFPTASTSRHPSDALNANHIPLDSTARGQSTFSIHKKPAFSTVKASHHSNKTSLSIFDFEDTSNTNSGNKQTQHLHQQKLLAPQLTQQQQLTQLQQMQQQQVLQVQQLQQKQQMQHKHRHRRKSSQSKLKQGASSGSISTNTKKIKPKAISFSSTIEQQTITNEKSLSSSGSGDGSQNNEHHGHSHTRSQFPTPVKNDQVVAAVHHGPIVSQTITQKDPRVVASRLEELLKKMKISYKNSTSNPLALNLYGPNVDLRAEVRKLYGFRKMYVISFKRIKGESHEYVQFVNTILAEMKKESH